MRQFTFTTADGRRVARTTARGEEVINTPLLNKGAVFSQDEREALGLVGLLPDGQTSLELELDRAYGQYNAKHSDLEKNVFLASLHDRNEVLFYALLGRHLTEMLPVVYDPTVGEAIEKYSHLYRRPRGVFLSIDRIDEIESTLAATGMGADEVDLIVATDAEEILGIGDWGAGGVDITVGKLAVYTAAAGIDPSRVIPVMLDVGTNRESLLNDPLYLGYRHSRARGEKYDAFIEAYVAAARKLFPNALLHWEDFGPGNARRIILKYRDDMPTFNDDMQGTGAITMAALFNGVALSGVDWKDHRVVIFGSGTAGVGIADQIRDQMTRSGLTEDEATRQFWLVDRQGLLLDDMEGLRDYQQGYARPASEVTDWPRNGAEGSISLTDTVTMAKPTIVIGTSTAPHTFTEAMVRTMAENADRPIIFPLSNPTPLAEATPEELLRWTGGRALVATGSPFDPVAVGKVTHTIGQANNAMLYPGLGLGVIVCRASKISDGMILAAAKAVASLADTSEPGSSLLPAFGDLRTVSATVAVAVIEQAQAEGLATEQIDDVVEAVREAMWQAEYTPIEAV